MNAETFTGTQAGDRSRAARLTTSRIHPRRVEPPATTKPGSVAPFKFNE